MNRRTTIWAGTFAVIVLGASAEAQRSRPRTAAIAPATPATPAAQAPSKAALPPRNAPPVRIAGIAPPPQPAAAPAAAHGYAYPVTTPQPIRFSYLPTLVYSDGRVYANFGNGRGYEQVLRQCPTFTGAIPPNYALAPCFIVDAYGRYSVIQQR